MSEEIQPKPIFETRNEEMGSHKNGEFSIRVARFLNPVARNGEKGCEFPKRPLLGEVLAHNNQQEMAPLVHFSDWRHPQRKWKEWVDKLSEEYSHVWKQMGIYNAIMSSTYDVRCNKGVILGLSEFWSPETNTFMFPWGEATVTLEDVMILGGLPVIGEPVNSDDIKDEMVLIEEKMKKYRSEMWKSKARRADHSTWLNYFMAEQREYEHAAFLVLWLSRYVFPTKSSNTIATNVFLIAAKLSLGVRVALAQPVLASLYRNLRDLTEAVVQGSSSSQKIDVLGQFQLLQIWALERFSLVKKKHSVSLQPVEAREAIWQKMNLKLNLPLVRSVLSSVDNFIWRPYVTSSNDFCCPSYYKETAQELSNCSSLDDGSRSFLIFVLSCDLAGLDCKEKYQPHRVAMQFGMDQDVPADFPILESTSQLVSFYIPSRSSLPGLSARYIKWWKDCIATRSNSIEALLHNGKLQAPETPLSHGSGSKGEDDHTQAKVAVDNPNDSTKFSDKGNPSPNNPEVPSKRRKKRFCDANANDDKLKPSSVVQINDSTSGLSKKAKLKPVLKRSEKENNCCIRSASQALKKRKKTSEASDESNCENSNENVASNPTANNNLVEDSGNKRESYVQVSSSLSKSNYSSAERAQSCIVHTNNREPEVSFHEKGNLYEQVNIQCVEVTKTKTAKSIKMNGFGQDVMTEPGSSSDGNNEPTDFSERGVQSTEGPKDKGEIGTVGLSLSIPGVIEAEKSGQDLGARILKLEKLFDIDLV